MMLTMISLAVIAMCSGLWQSRAVGPSMRFPHRVGCTSTPFPYLPGAGKRMCFAKCPWFLLKSKYSPMRGLISKSSIPTSLATLSEPRPAEFTTYFALTVSFVTAGLLMPDAKNTAITAAQDNTNSPNRPRGENTSMADDKAVAIAQAAAANTAPTAALNGKAAGLCLFRDRVNLDSEALGWSFTVMPTTSLFTRNSTPLSAAFSARAIAYSYGVTVPASGEYRAEVQSGAMLGSISLSSFCFTMRRRFTPFFLPRASSS
mmetsp:Transcript_4031/g.7753  ORF Transcript_4031/g.7753 Transcript_4031/m.7753 type:complete len:260 (-) Transcript_4031:519-1298(-)